MKKYLLLLLIFLLISCTITSNVTDSNKIKIGGVFDLSGFATEWGIEDLKGAKLGLNSDYDFIIEDGKSTQKDCINALQKLINVDKVDFIIGPSWLETTCMGGAPLSKDVLFITPSGVITTVQKTDYYPNIFSTWYGVDYEAEYFLENVHGSNSMIQGMAPYWFDWHDELNNSLLSSFIVDSDTQDFKTLLLKVKKEDPDNIFVGLDTEKQLLNFLQQRALIYPEANIYFPEYVESFIHQDSFEGLFTNVHVIRPLSPDKNFIQLYNLTYGSQPLLSASNSYDATKVLSEAIDNTDGSLDEVRNYLLSNSFDTVTFGKTGFDELNGVSGGGFEIVYYE